MLVRTRTPLRVSVYLWILDIHIESGNLNGPLGSHLVFLELEIMKFTARGNPAGKIAFISWQLNSLGQKTDGSS